MNILRALAANFDDYRVLLFYYWIEACFIAYVGLGLLGIRIDFRKIIRIGIFHGLTVYWVRGIYKILEIPFGTHTLILAIIMSIFISRIGRLRWGIGLTASLLGIVLLMLGESLVLPNFHKILNISLEEMWSNPWTHVLAGYVGDILLLFLALLIFITNFALVRVRDY